MVTLGFAVLASALVSAAEPIRVVLVMPKGSQTLARQVSRFDDALRRSTGRIAWAGSLVDADAVVQFTNYRRTVNHEGKSADWWYGQYKLLSPPPQQESASRPSVEPFIFVVGDAEDWHVEPAVNLLAEHLARALELAPSSAKRPFKSHGAAEQGVEADEAR
jgi:hypothetical protein